MKICPNCQHENNDSSLFCSNCGTRLPEEAPKQEENQNSEIRFDPLTGERIYGSDARFDNYNQARENSAFNDVHQNNNPYNSPYNNGYYASTMGDSSYGLALAGLLVSLLLSDIIGLILSIVAMVKDKEKRHLGLEIAGIVVAALSMLLKVILIVYMVTHADELEAYLNNYYGYIALFF